MEKAILGNGKFLYVNDCSVKTYIHRSTNGVSSGIGKIKGEMNFMLIKNKDLMNSKKVQFIILKQDII